MNTTVETIDYKGFTIEIYTDETPEDPREWDNLGIMVCFHKRYQLGDYDYTKNELGLKHNDFTSWAEMEEHLKKECGAVLILPLYMYDHSGITISTSPFSCPWDSGRIGFIYTTGKKIRDEFGWEKTRRAPGRKWIDKAKDILLNEVRLYDQYVKGEVYGYRVTGDYKAGDCDEPSCWGFFGYDWEKNGLLENARGEIDYLLKERERKNKLNAEFVTAVVYG